MPKPQVSVIKRQREQAKREKQQNKADRRAQRKAARENGTLTDDIIADDIEPMPQGAD
ncbi:MAG TPA: hypothetical protein VNI54_03920 [Thermoanaerobaculia bacterium]|nr:hypothetical protein [Thermoanaerobaculia bacterium]